jgi:HK97 family phage major capsid protein
MIATRGAKTVSDIRSEIDARLGESQSILDSANFSGVELDAEQAAEFEAILDDVETNLRPKLRAAEALREKKLRIAESQSLLSDPVSSLGVRPGLPFGISMNAAHTNPQSRLASRLKCFSSIADAQLSGEFLRNVITGDIRAAMTEGDPTAGGYTVPEVLSRSIIDKREAVGISRQTAMVQPMISDVLVLPKLVSGPSVSYVGEASAITPVDQVWGQIRLTTRKRAVLVKISNELLSDSVVNLSEYVASRAAFELAKQEDREYVLGDGTSTYGNVAGLLNKLGSAGVTDAASGHDSWATIDLADLTAAMGTLPSDYGDNTAWICSPQFYYSVMLRLLAGAGGNDIVMLEAGGSVRPTFLGRKVYLSSAMPTSSAASTVSVLYGVFDQAVAIGDRVAIAVAISADKYFDEDCTGIRILARYDINVHEGGDANDAGAFVGLATAS